MRLKTRPYYALQGLVQTTGSAGGYDFKNRINPRKQKAIPAAALIYKMSKGLLTTFPELKFNKNKTPCSNEHGVDFLLE